MCSRHVPPSLASPLCVSDLCQVQLPTVHPLSSLVSNRHGTCPESRRRDSNSVPHYSTVHRLCWGVMGPWGREIVMYTYCQIQDAGWFPITSPRIVRFRWNLVRGCIMGLLRTRSDWNPFAMKTKVWWSANSQYLIRYNSAVDRSISLKYGIGLIMSQPKHCGCSRSKSQMSRSQCDITHQQLKCLCK